MRINLQSEKDVYYVYDSCKLPLRRDAWGITFLGDCYAKKDSSFIQKVAICEISNSTSIRYAFQIWKLLKEKNVDFGQTSFIPIVDYINSNPYLAYLIEDYYTGVSLYDLMQGKVDETEEQTNEFAIEMHKHYKCNRIGFATMVSKEILKGIKYMLDNEVGIRYIEPPENIFFTKEGEIRIRMINCIYGEFKGTIRQEWVWQTFPIEYETPEGNLGMKPDEKSNVYSVGILLFAILTGHLPYNGGASLEEYHRMHSHYFSPFEDDYSYEPHLRLFINFSEKLLLDEIDDLQLRAIIKKATETNPNKRYHSITEFIKALETREETSLSWYKKTDMAIMNVFRFSKHRLTSLLWTIFTATLFISESYAQTHMRIHLKGGDHSDIPIEQIDSITFVDGGDAYTDETGLAGSWLWGNTESGYYELLTFNEDKTYTGYDNYFAYGIDTTTYGWYGLYGTLLTLQSNGFGYRRRYQWYMMGVTDNALDVMTKTGRFVYYKLRSETITLKVGGSPYICDAGESFIFSDEVITHIEGKDKLYGISKGITYIQKCHTDSETIYSYKVVVE